MTTEIKTLTTSEAAARVGISNQYLRFLLSKGKGPKGTREGKGGRGGGYKFLAEDIDAWDAARVKRSNRLPPEQVEALDTADRDRDLAKVRPATSEEHARYTAAVAADEAAERTEMDAAKREQLEAAGWKVGSAEDFLGGEHPFRRLARESMDPLGVEISGEDVDLLGVEISGSGTDAFKSLISAVCCAPEFAGMADDRDDE